MEKIDKTYREAIKESLDKFKTERIVLDDFVKEESESLPLCFGYFCKSISAILNVVITQMCKEDYPNVEIGSHKYNGKQKKDVSAKDVLDVIHHVQDEVKRQFGVELHTEVRILGEDK